MLGRERKWRNDPDKVRACELRKRKNPITGEYFTDTDIYLIFANEGITYYKKKLGFFARDNSDYKKEDKVEKSTPEPKFIEDFERKKYTKKEPVQTKMDPPLPEVSIDDLQDVKEIDETLYKRMLLNACKTNPADIKIISELRGYLDKTDGFETKKSDINLTEDEITDVYESAKDYIKQNS